MGIYIMRLQATRQILCFVGVKTKDPMSPSIIRESELGTDGLKRKRLECMGADSCRSVNLR